MAGTHETVESTPIGVKLPVWSEGRKRHPMNGLGGNVNASTRYLLRGRYYSTHTARFLSADSAGVTESALQPRTLNRYTYALNNPISTLDPTGQWNENFHLGEMYLLALQAGFSESEAWTYARASNDVDFGETSPWHPDPGIRHKWHGFRYSMEDPGAHWYEINNWATWTSDNVEFFRRLHPVTDVYSHLNFTAEVGQAARGGGGGRT